MDGESAGTVPLGQNTAGSPLIFGTNGSPHDMDELILWERAAGLLEMSAAGSGSASQLYSLPAWQPMQVTSFRHGYDSTTGADQVEIHWSPSIPATPWQVQVSDDLSSWTNALTTTELSAILENSAPVPGRAFYQVRTVP